MDLQELLFICRKSHEDSLYKDTGHKILSGFSGYKLCGLLQNLTSKLEGTQNVYLEIGVYQGLTLLSNACSNKNVKCYGIDNFSLFNEGGKNKDIVLERKKVLNANNAHIIDKDFEEALDDLDKYFEKGEKVGVFFIDGAHDYRSQLISLLKIKKYLSNDALIVIDDANYAHVRQATVDFLMTEPEFKLICEAYTKAHPANLSKIDKEHSIKGWWNGINIITKDENIILDNMIPEIDLINRNFHFKNHDVMRSKYTEILFDLSNLCQELINSNESESEIINSIKELINKQNEIASGRFEHHNTYSEGLPEFKINKLKK